MCDDFVDFRIITQCWSITVHTHTCGRCASSQHSTAWRAGCRHTYSCKQSLLDVQYPMLAVCWQHHHQMIPSLLRCGWHTANSPSRCQKQSKALCVGHNTATSITTCVQTYIFPKAIKIKSRRKIAVAVCCGAFRQADSQNLKRGGRRAQAPHTHTARHGMTQQACSQGASTATLAHHD